MDKEEEWNDYVQMASIVGVCILFSIIVSCFVGYNTGKNLNNKYFGGKSIAFLMILVVIALSAICVYTGWNYADKMNSYENIVLRDNKVIEDFLLYQVKNNPKYRWSFKSPSGGNQTPEKTVEFSLFDKNVDGIDEDFIKCIANNYNKDHINLWYFLHLIIIVRANFILLEIKQEFPNDFVDPIYATEVLNSIVNNILNKIDYLSIPDSEDDGWAYNLSGYGNITEKLTEKSLDEYSKSCV